MIIKTIIGALALTISTAAFAAESAPTKECCCCAKSEDGKMACCDKDKKADGHDGSHEGKDMGGMSHE